MYWAVKGQNGILKMTFNLIQKTIQEHELCTSLFPPLY